MINVRAVSEANRRDRFSVVGVTYQPVENILCMVGSGSGSEFLSCSATAVSSAGDVIRAQTEYLSYGFAKLIMVKLN